VATRKVEFRESYFVYCLAFGADATQLATAGTDTGLVHIWPWRNSAAAPQTLQSRMGCQINGLRYSPDGSLLAIAHNPTESDELVRMWNNPTGDVAATISEPHSGGAIYAGMEFSPDGRFLMFCEFGQGQDQPNFFVYDTTTWQRVWAMSTKPLRAATFALSRDGRYAAIVGDELGGSATHPVFTSKILIVDLAARRVSRIVQAPGMNTHFIAWHPDGKRIVMSSNYFVTIDVDTGRVTSRPVDPDHSAVALQYSPDGKYLMIGTLAGVELWDAEHTKVVQTISGRMNLTRFSPDGRYLAMSVGNNGISIWAVN
jgi:WD40 repeat protein